jgi:hypothetical protein
MVFRVGDDNRKLSFVARLARENRWTVAHAERVYREYLKFMYLAATSAQSVTPSDQVDQVWHLHLCYSDSYWRELCGELMEKKIHHGPTKGGGAENRRYWDQYEATLVRYTEVFEQAPDPDIWPTAAERFSSGQRFVRVDLSHSLVIRKKTIGAVFGVIGTVLLFSGCTKYLEEKGVEADQVLAVVFIVALLYYLFRVIRDVNWGRRGKGGRGGGVAGDARLDVVVADAEAVVAVASLPVPAVHVFALLKRGWFFNLCV